MLCLPFAETTNGGKCDEKSFSEKIKNRLRRKFIKCEGKFSSSPPMNKKWYQKGIFRKAALRKAMRIIGGSHHWRRLNTNRDDGKREFFHHNSDRLPCRYFFNSFPAHFRSSEVEVEPGVHFFPHFHSSSLRRSFSQSFFPSVPSFLLNF